MSETTLNSSNLSVQPEIVGEESPFKKLIQTGEYEYYFERGQIVSGKVVEYSRDGALVNIGAKCEAFLPNKEICDYSSGDPADVLPLESEYEFYILRDEAANTQDGRIIVSYRRVAQARIWSSLEQHKEESSICEARVQEVVKGGVVVEINGLRGFIPASHLRVKGGSNNPQLIGQTIPCTVLEIDRQQNKLILSQKLAISKLYAGEREKLMNSLVEALRKYEEDIASGIEAQVVQVDGEVVRITDFGAFVKIADAEMDGLLPLSEISWKRLSHPSEVLQIGNQLKVQVLNVVPEQSRISLSLKRLLPDPWSDVKETIKVGDVLKGKINRITNYGVYLTIGINSKPIEEYGFEALLPADEMKGAPEATKEEKLAPLELEDELIFAVKKIKEDDRRLILSSKCLDENNKLIPGSLDPVEENRQSSSDGADSSGQE